MKEKLGTSECNCNLSAAEAEVAGSLGLSG